MEELLLSQLWNDKGLCGFLTEFQNRPAIFYQKAPKDEDIGWKKPCFPHIEFVVDRTGDPERKESGKLYIHVWVSSDCLSPSGGNLDREIEKYIQKVVDGTFYTSDGVSTCATWVHSFQFQSRTSDKNMEVSPVETYGVTMEFDLIEFHSQVATDPDPIQGANGWIKTHFPEVLVIGWDDMPPIWQPSDEYPAIYWRLGGYEGDERQTYSVNWYVGQFALHLFTKTVSQRNTWLKTVVESLQLEGEILLLDESPLFIKKILIVHQGDALREGQLKMWGEYGVLVQRRKEKASPSLSRVGFPLKKKKEEKEGKNGKLDRN